MTVVSIVIKLNLVILLLLLETNPFMCTIFIDKWVKNDKNERCTMKGIKT